MKFDLHVHSRHSPDSSAHVADIIKRAVQTGLQGIAVTDHNSLAGSREALEISDGSLVIIPGAEYATDMGHLLVYFLKNGLEDLELETDDRGLYKWSEIISKAHEQDAVVFLAHPFKRRREYTPEFLDALDGLEVYNSRAALCRDREANMKALKEAERLGKPYCAGSDAHWPGEIGGAFWECACNTGDIAEIERALLEGNGNIWGKASSRLYEPASQIVRRIKARELRTLPKTILKLTYVCMLETLRLLRLEKRPLEGYVIRKD